MTNPDYVLGHSAFELEQLTFPWAIEASRFTIARMVLEHLDDSKDSERIKKVVLRCLAENGDVS